MGLFYDLLFNTVSRPLIEATGAQVPGLWCCIARVGASGLQGWASALGPRKLTLRCLASLAKKLFYFCFCFVLVFSFHLNVFLRTGKIKQNPKVFAPSPEPARGCLSPSLPSIGLSFSLLSTYMGWGSGWVGAFWGSGPGNRGTRESGIDIASRLGFAAAVVPSPSSPQQQNWPLCLHLPPSPAGFLSLIPKMSLSLFLFCLLLVLFWFWFLYFFNFNFSFFFLFLQF